MKIFLVHPCGAPNRPEVVYTRRSDVPVYSTENEEVVELDVPVRRFVAVQQGLGVTPLGKGYVTFAEADAAHPEADCIIEVVL